MVSVQEIKKQDTTTILADIVGLSTDEKPTTLGGKSVANGSTFVEMNTSDIYLYDQQNEEWKKFSGGSGGGGGGSTDSSVIIVVDNNGTLNIKPSDVVDENNQFLDKYCFLKYVNENELTYLNELGLFIDENENLISIGFGTEDEPLVYVDSLESDEPFNSMGSNLPPVTPNY